MFIGEPIKYNIKLSIVAAEVGSDSEQLIEVTSDTITTKGYTSIQFKVEFLSVNSANAIEVKPILLFENMDDTTSLIFKNTAISNIIVEENSNIGISSSRDETTMSFNDKVKNQNDVAVATNLSDNFWFKMNFSDTSDSHQISVMPYLRKKIGTLSIKAISDDGTPVSGAEYLLEDSSGKMVAKLRTNKDGIATRDNLDYGQYTLKEDGNDAQYSEEKKTTYISLNKRSSNISLTTEYYNNSDQVGSIVVHATNAKLGDIFYIYDEEGNLVEKLVLDENGNATSKGLKYGNYTIIGEGGSVKVTLNKDIVFANFDLDYPEENSGSEIIESEESTNTTKSSANAIETESSISNSTWSNLKNKFENYTTIDDKSVDVKELNSELQSDVSVESEKENEEHSQINNNRKRSIILICGGGFILLIIIICASSKVIRSER